MDSPNRRGFSLILLIISSIICLQARADGSGSVFFLDSSAHRYLRPRSSESKLMLLPEVGAAISVLLGFAPPSTLSSASSEKLNEVLMPNPFNRPGAVFMLEINGIEDKQPGLDLGSDVFGKALKNRVAFGQNDADIQLSDDEVSVVSLNGPLPSDMELTDKDLTDFASSLGGLYVSTTLEPLSGELTVPLTNDAKLTLHMSKKADKEFTTNLISLIQNVRRAVLTRQDSPGGMHRPAELIKGKFDGVEALREQYGTDDIVRQSIELLVISISEIYDSLQSAYKGEIVGIVLFNESPSQELLPVKFTSRPASRWLEESRSKGLPNSIVIAEIMLVRLTLAWLTGIILIIATLMGVYFLMYMPITRDTLLYSNVKLD